MQVSILSIVTNVSPTVLLRTGLEYILSFFFQSEGATGDHIHKTPQVKTMVHQFVCPNCRCFNCSM